VKPTIGIDPIESVVLTIPYFSALKATDAATGDNTYTLDSIYGNGKIKLSVFESRFAFQNLDQITLFSHRSTILTRIQILWQHSRKSFKR
jgi:hypothetical protein